MSEVTKACNLTMDEMWAVQQYHAQQIINCGPNYDAPIERMSYINKRLKAFNEVEIVKETQTEAPAEAAPKGGW